MSAINSAAEVSPAQAMRWRLRQQYLDKSAPDPAEVASRLGGIHAQVMSSAVKIRSGWGVMLKPAAARGLLCFGPDRDRNVTFTDPRSHLPTLSWDDIDPDLALRTIVSRFLDTYGPATHEDFGRWWGTDAASARRIFAGHGLAQRCPVQDRRIDRNNVPASAHWAWSSRRLPPILLPKGRS